MPRVAPALQPPPYLPKAALPSPPVTGARAASGSPFAGVNSSIIKFLVINRRSSGTLWQQFAVCTQEHMVPGGEGRKEAKVGPGSPWFLQTLGARRGGCRAAEPEPGGHSDTYSPRPGSCSGGC